MYVEDSTPPAPPQVTATVPPSPSRSTMPHVQGTAPEATSVTLYGTPDCTGTVLGMGPVTADAFDIQATVTTPITPSIYPPPPEPQRWPRPRRPPPTKPPRGSARRCSAARRRRRRATRARRR